jgi:hypothetical protein
MSYNALEAAARAKVDQRLRLQSLTKAKSVDDSAGDSMSTEQSQHSYRDGRTSSSEDGLDEIAHLSSSVASDLQALSKSAQAHSGEKGSRTYDGLMISSIYQLSEKVKIMTGQLYQRLREGQEGVAPCFSPTDSGPAISDASQSMDDNLKLEEVLRNLKESVRRLQCSTNLCSARKPSKQSDI